MTSKICAATVLLAGLWAASAQAALVISTTATSNVSCSGGVCAATAANAVLNAHDLMVSLAHGDTTLVSGSIAQDIEFDTPVHWTPAHRLTLDSYHAITFTQPVLSEGAGGMTITINDGGTGGDFIFTGKGRVAFWNLSSSLIINGASYTLAGNIATLASDIAANTSGNYALANNYDASVDGAYTQSPVSSYFFGIFEGLGNTISHLSINGGSGLFGFVGEYGAIRDLNMYGEVVRAPSGANVGGLVGRIEGNLVGVSVIGGSVTAGSGYAAIGGLVGRQDNIGDPNTGDILRSHSSARIVCGSFCFAGGLAGDFETGRVQQSSATGSVSAGNNSMAGGLVGKSSVATKIILSHATGSVSTGNGFKDTIYIHAMAGGLIGYNQGLIDRSYATGAVSGGSGINSKNEKSYVWVGGLVGSALSYQGIIKLSYATGAVSVGDQGYAGGFTGAGSTSIIRESYSTGAVSSAGSSLFGGFVGQDTGRGGNPVDYWDLDTSGVDHGAGNGWDYTIGLTTAQLQSGLPAGFDPTIWGQSPGINNGLPYLLALVP